MHVHVCVCVCVVFLASYTAIYISLNLAHAIVEPSSPKSVGQADRLETQGGVNAVVLEAAFVPLWEI